MEDFKKIFQICPGVEKVYLTNANQFKDEVLHFVTQHPTIHLAHLRLDGANLITKEGWMEFFSRKGASVETLKLSFLETGFDDEVLASVVEHCPRLERLKLHLVVELGGESMERLGGLQKLKHLTWVRGKKEVGTQPVMRMLEKIGGQLETLALDKFDELDDEVLGAIHTHCHRLRKFRITDNSNFTDRAFHALFTDWVNPPLTYASFRMCRHLDANQPVDNPDGIGFCSDGFTSMMLHSGHQLDRLHLTACRHISHDAFAAVLNGEKRFERLRSLDLSFCNSVDDMILAGVFRSCPNIKMVWAFGCFEVKQVVVPPTAILLGRLHAEGELAVDGNELAEENV